MPTRRELIQKITLNSDASSITFSNISQNYTDLKIISSIRSMRNSNSDAIKIRFNSASTDASLTCRFLEGNGATVTTASQAIGLLGTSTASTNTALTFATYETYISNYLSTINNKPYISKSVSENNATTAFTNIICGLYSSSVNISSINILSQNGANMAANSTFYLYGITQVPIIRGGEVSIAGGFKYHTFKSTGSLQVIEGGDVEYLVVAGGGGGAVRGNRGGGGGGAGGVLTGKSRLGAGTYIATVGGGGTGPTYIVASVDGQDGSGSSISTISSTGGGGGGGATGRNGGSGGGAGGNEGASGGTGISGQGYAGGAGATGNPIAAGGGGGGASQVGTSGSTSTGGKGGDGLTTLLVGGVSSVVGGGGGGGGDATPGAGGAGGGGAGGGSGSGTDAVANTGGGGGGAGDAGSTANSAVKGGNGGSGIVVIRYPYDGN